MKTMKLNNLFLAMLMALNIFFFGCSKDETVTKEPSKIDTSDIMLAIESGSKSFSFVAADDWTASLSTSSWIKIDPMTKAGSKGESVVKLEWTVNTSIKERVTDLTIAVRDENPVKIRITQMPEQAMVTVSKSEINMIVNPEAANGKGQFVDTVNVKSNIKWIVKDLPNWIEYSTVDNKEPQEGVPTDIQLVLSANPKYFAQTEMITSLKIGKSGSADVDATLNAKAITEMKALDTDKKPLSSLVIRKSVAANNKFVASFHLVANTSWKLKSAPEWVEVSHTNNNTQYAMNLHSDIVVWLTMSNANLDTDPKSGKVVFVDEKTNTELSLDLTFEGIGADFFEYEIDHNPDQLFDATKFDENWNPIPGAVLAKELIMFTSKDYTSLNEAPFKAHFVHSNNGIATQQEALWLGLDFPMDPFNGRSPLVSKKLELFVQDRMNDYGDKFNPRYAFMIITPASVSFDDMFEYGQLKSEYRDASVMIGQHAMPRPPFTTDIPEVVRFKAVITDKDAQIFHVLSGPEELGSRVEDSSWLTVDFDTKGGGVKIIVKPETNTTGKARTQTATITEWVGEEQITVCEFSVFQAAE